MRSFFDGTEREIHAAQPFLWIFVCTVLVAQGARMVVLTLGGDDWSGLVDPTFQYDVILGQGRWLYQLIWRLADNNRFAPATGIALAAAAYLFISFLFCRALAIKSAAGPALFAALAISFPLTAEIFSFKMSMYPLAAGLGLAGFAGACVILAYEEVLRRGYGKAAVWGLAGALGFMATGAIFQQLVEFSLALVVARSIGLLREEGGDRVHPAGPLLTAVPIFALGLGCYALSLVLSVAVTGVPLVDDGTRYAIVGASVKSLPELMSAIGFSVSLLPEFLFHESHLFPRGAKILFAAIILFLVICLGRRSPGRAAAFALLMLGLLLIPFSLGMVRSVSPFRYTSLIALAVPYAVAFILALDLSSGRWRRVTLAALAVTLTIFCFEQNRASVTTWLINERDKAVASRILERITAAPDFAPFAGRHQANIIFVGRLREAGGTLYPFRADAPDTVSPFITAIDSCGIFACQPGHIEAMLTLIGDISMRYSASLWPSLPAGADVEQLKDRIRAAHPWPAPDAVIYDRDLIVVVLSQPRDL